jgi:hypothetical protein
LAQYEIDARSPRQIVGSQEVRLRGRRGNNRRRRRTEKKIAQMPEREQIKELMSGPEDTSVAERDFKVSLSPSDSPSTSIPLK